MKLLRTIFYSLFIFSLIFSIVSPSISARAQASVQPDLQALDAFLQAQVRSNRIPGLAVAVVKGDEVIFQKGYGQAAPGNAVTPQTQFYIGSVTKGFTALAVMQLVEQGKLELDAPVQKYLPWFQVADPQASAHITIRSLLNHTSGLSETGDPNASAYTASLEEQARLLRFVRPNAQAGARYQYYNQNYRLLGLLVEKASGQSYGSYLKTNVFTPLGMNQSAANPADAPELAQGYSRALGFPLPQSQRFIPGALPSGYLITTAGDMARYLLAQLNNRQANGQPLLSPRSLTLMRTPPAGIASDYGMGWMVMENGNTLAHGGALENFQSVVALGLKEKIGFVILFNQNSMENMLFENSVIRDGMVNFLNGKPLPANNYGWVGWVLFALVAADLLNHLRLLLKLPRWVEKAARQSRPWLWVKISAGILFPLAIIFGLPQLMHALEGGSPNWLEPLRLMPDLTVWLLLGMGLNLLRNILHAVSLARLQVAY
jgi:CubicO group peptidase (beta-lactamase class C family)